MSNPSLNYKNSIQKINLQTSNLIFSKELSILNSKETTIVKQSKSYRAKYLKLYCSSSAKIIYQNKVTAKRIRKQRISLIIKTFLKVK